MTGLKALAKLRAQFAAQVEEAQRKLAVIDNAIAVLGGEPEAAPKPRKKRVAKTHGANGHAPAQEIGDAQAILLSELKDRREGVTSRVLRDDLGWPPTKFKAVIAAAIASGKVVKFGERAGTGYRLAE